MYLLYLKMLLSGCCQVSKTFPGVFPPKQFPGRTFSFFSIQFVEANGEPSIGFSRFCSREPLEGHTDMLPLPLLLVWEEHEPENCIFTYTTPPPTPLVIPPSWFFCWHLPAKYKTPSSVRADVTQKLIKDSFLASLTRKGGWPSDAKQDHSFWSTTQALLGKTLTIPPLHPAFKEFSRIIEEGLQWEPVQPAPCCSPSSCLDHQSPQDKLIGVLSRNSCLVISKYSFQQLRKRLSHSLNAHAPVTRLTDRDNWVMNKVTLPSAFPPANIKREWVLSPPPLPTSFSRPPTLCLHWSSNLEIWHPLL